MRQLMMAVYCALLVALGRALYTHYLSKSQHSCEVDTVTIYLPFTQRETEAQRLQPSLKQQVAGFNPSWRTPGPCS